MQTHRRTRSPTARSSKTISLERPISPRMHSKRPSLSGPMTWLSRSSSSSSVQHPYAPSKPIRISEPQMTSAFDSVGKRSGPLGAGATVVRTPQEALAGPRLASPTAELEREPEHEILEEEEEEQEYVEEDTLVEQRPHSRALPPIPDKEEALPKTPAPRSTTPSRPTRPPPPAPEEDEAPSPATSSPSTPSPRRPSLKVLDSFPPVPALPVNLLPSPPQPEFEAILLSSPPHTSTDPNKVIVTIETATQTYKTTLKTLTSRPSYLSTYLQDLLSAPETDEADDDKRDSRISDADSSFRYMFRQHLASTGLVQTSTNLHIFLDRPSAPYAHILSYLRLPPSTPEQPASLPRAAQLLSSSSSRLEALLELRDEARYLDLEELYRLCTDELRSRQTISTGRASMHLRAISNTSVSTSSVRSLGMNAFREADDVREVEEGHERRLSGDSGIGSSNSHSGRVDSPRESLAVEIGWPSSVPSLAQRGRTPAKKFTSMRTKPSSDWI